MLNVLGSMSTNTGLAPKRVTQLTVAKNVKLGTNTSSPGCRSIAISDSNSASLPDAQPIAKSVSQYSATSFSKFEQCEPPTNRPDEMISTITSWNSCLSGSLDRLTSRSGTICLTVTSPPCNEIVIGVRPQLLLHYERDISSKLPVRAKKNKVSNWRSQYRIRKVSIAPHFPIDRRAIIRKYLRLPRNLSITILTTRPWRGSDSSGFSPSAAAT